MRRVLFSRHRALRSVQISSLLVGFEIMLNSLIRSIIFNVAWVVKFIYSEWTSWLTVLLLIIVGNWEYYF